MINYLQKFNNLDVELREKVSGPKVMKEMKHLEQKYRVNLATVIMRIMVHDISILDLSKFFMFEYEMEARHAENLVEEMKKTVLRDVADYVGFFVDSAPSLEESNDNDLDTWKNRQQGPRVKTSDFFFSTEDEAEVRDLAKKLETFKTERKKKGSGTEAETMQNVEEIVSEVTKRINLSFSSNELSSRFVKIVNTYVKNVRSKIDTKETLMKDVESGGMDLNDDLSVRVISVIDQVKEEYKEKKLLVKPKKIELPEDVTSNSIPSSSSKSDVDGKDEMKKKSGGSLGMVSARDVDYDFGKLKKAPPQDVKKDDSVNFKEAVSEGESKNSVFSSVKEVYDDEGSEKKEDGKDTSLSYEDVTREDAFHLSSSEKDESEPDKDKTSGLNEVNSRTSKSIPTKTISEPKINKPTINKRGVETSAGKVKMEDVKFVPKLVGPIDELRDMSIEDWRRLGNSPEEFTDKIIEKINFLEKESYKKRLAGIKAWRQSPVNLAYLEIGQNSMIHSKNLSEVIGGIISSGGETLNLSEFNAVMELNKKLRF